MKKSLVALAVLASFGGTAFAQSSVTLYGLIDMGVGKGNGGTAANNSAFGLSKAWTAQQSTSSRLGFRGTEDLGGGLSAQFQIEHRFNPDTGTENLPGTFWAGRSWVQLTSAGVGSVYMGRQYLPTFWVQLKADPFGWNGIGQLGTMQNAGFAAQGSGSSIRSSNSVGFKSANFGGLSFEGLVGLSEASQLGRNDNFNVIYKAGPIFAGLGYGRVKGGPASVNGNKLLTVTGAYDLGVVELLANYAEGKTAGGTQKNKFGNIGANVPLAGGNVKVAYGILDPFGPNNKQKKFAVGYDYPLSKRTNLYADLGIGTQTNRTRNTAYMFGVVHTF
ncbi:MAG: porin [Ideonella sp.]